MCVLEDLDHARARGARIYAEVAGYGITSDAWHVTAPREDGAGAVRAMRLALRRAGVTPGQVGYVNAHATGTVKGDEAENRAIRAVMLGEHGKLAPRDVLVSSTKGATGHLLGAAGAVEAIFAVMAMHTGVVPPTINLDTPGPGEGYDFNYVPHRAQERNDLDVVLTNSFGFGGTNASLCFTKYKP